MTEEEVREKLDELDSIESMIAYLGRMKNYVYYVNDDHMRGLKDILNDVNKHLIYMRDKRLEEIFKDNEQPLYPFLESVLKEFGYVKAETRGCVAKSNDQTTSKPVGAASFSFASSESASHICDKLHHHIMHACKERFNHAKHYTVEWNITYGDRCES